MITICLYNLHIIFQTTEDLMNIFIASEFLKDTL